MSLRRRLAKLPLWPRADIQQPFQHPHVWFLGLEDMARERDLESVEAELERKPRPLIVLVVEDDVLIRMAMAEALRRLGIVAIEARSSDEALEVLHSGLVPDALLTDIRMPGTMDGLSLSALSEAMHPGIRVFITSGVIAPDDLKLRLNFLPKPVDPNEAARRIADALRGSAR